MTIILMGDVQGVLKAEKNHTLEESGKASQRSFSSISGESTKYEAGRGKIWLDRQARATLGRVTPYGGLHMVYPVGNGKPISHSPSIIEQWIIPHFPSSFFFLLYPIHVSKYLLSPSSGPITAPAIKKLWSHLNPLRLQICCQPHPQQGFRAKPPLGCLLQLPSHFLGISYGDFPPGISNGIFF